MNLKLIYQAPELMGSLSGRLVLHGALSAQSAGALILELKDRAFAEAEDMGTPPDLIDAVYRRLMVSASLA